MISCGGVYQMIEGEVNTSKPTWKSGSCEEKQGTHRGETAVSGGEANQGTERFNWHVIKIK